MPKPALANSVEAYIDADGLKTFYVKAGSGFPVVLFHGAAPGASAQVNWQLNIEPLAAAGFTVYAYDQAGYGRSDNPADLSIEYRVTHAKAFVDALKLDRYHVIGNSVGGYIAARLALEDARVGRFVTTTSGTLAPKGSAAIPSLGAETFRRAARVCSESGKYARADAGHAAPQRAGHRGVGAGAL